MLISIPSGVMIRVRKKSSSNMPDTSVTSAPIAPEPAWVRAKNRSWCVGGPDGGGIIHGFSESGICVE